MSFELAFGSRVASIMEALTEKAVQDICQLMGETYAALRVEMLQEQNQSSIKLQAIANNIEKEKPANCMEIIQKPASPTGLRDFPVVEQILNEQEANGLWLEGHLTVEDEGPPSLVPEEEQPLQIFGQMTDKGVETCSAPLLIKQEETDDVMESQGYSGWMPETHKANQNIIGKSDEEERSQASRGSKELGLDVFKKEQSLLLVSIVDAAAPTKRKKYNIRYTCKICGKTGTKKGRMTSHLITHKGTSSCDICGDKFKHQNGLTKHKLLKHSVKTYSCFVCGKMFLYSKIRDYHERIHVGEDYWCADCGKTFKERQDRDMHECIVCKGDRPYSCSECNKDFERQYHLKQHQLEKHPLLVDQTVDPEPESKDIEDQQSQLFELAESSETEAPTRFTCDICGMIIMNKGNINRHKLIHTKKPFSCDVCGENFKSHTCLAKHQGKHKSVEEKIEPYSCSMCGMRFVFPKMRDNHECKHIGEDFWCSGCDKTFKERGDRDEHKCTVYKRDRPFRCSECNEDFERQYHLKRHRLEKHPLMLDQTRPGHDTATVVQGAQPSNDNDPKADTSTLGGKVPVTNSG